MNNNPIQKTAFELWDSSETKTFVPTINHYHTENFITYFWSDERCVATTITEFLTIYTGNETQQIVGIRLNIKDNNEKYRLKEIEKVVKDLLQSVNDKYPDKNPKEWNCKYFAELDKLVNP